ncbi:hypothetical protein BD779DRAFT_1472424 [Infundibulicybe gibba]|nr:hypothetical protein BD779DRAFT_1472424 [Infundibulicybe gibba]
MSESLIHNVYILAQTDVVLMSAGPLLAQMGVEPPANARKICEPTQPRSCVWYRFRLQVCAMIVNRPRPLSGEDEALLVGWALDGPTTKAPRDGAVFSRRSAYHRADKGSRSPREDLHTAARTKAPRDGAVFSRRSAYHRANGSRDRGRFKNSSWR